MSKHRHVFAPPHERRQRTNNHRNELPSNYKWGLLTGVGWEEARRRRRRRWWCIQPLTRSDYAQFAYGRYAYLRMFACLCCIPQYISVLRTVLIRCTTNKSGCLESPAVSQTVLFGVFKRRIRAIRFACSIKNKCLIIKVDVANEIDSRL